MLVGPALLTTESVLFLGKLFLGRLKSPSSDYAADISVLQFRVAVSAESSESELLNLCVSLVAFLVIRADNEQLPTER